MNRLAARLAWVLPWVVAAVLAWTLPQPKPDAVLGRLSYGQFWLAVFLSAVALLMGTLQLLPHAWRRAVAFRAAALLMSFLIALAAVELLAAFLPVRHQMDNPWYLAAGGGAQASDKLPFERPPHLVWQGPSRGDLAILNGDADPYARIVSFETDMHGFRNSRDIYKADLVTIGDSFTEAGNVMEEETFTTLAGKLLGMSTRNLGRAGYTAGSELIVLQEYALPCQPRAVVWQLTGSNDLDEMWAHQKWVSRGRPTYFDVPRSTRTEAWQARSPTFRLFTLLRDNSPRPWPLEGTFRDEHGVEHPMRFLWAPDVHTPVLNHPAWPLFSRELLEGARLCASNDIQLLVLTIPMKGRVMGPFTRFSNSVTNDFSPPAAGSMGRVLEAFCAEHQIGYVDTTPALQAHAKTGKVVYLPYDTHLSPLGHEVIAQVIADAFKAAELQFPKPQEAP